MAPTRTLVVMLFRHRVVFNSLWPVDCCPPGSSVHRIFQARILESVAISFSRDSSQPRSWTHVSCIGREIFYQWATSEALSCTKPSEKSNHWALPSCLKHLVMLCFQPSGCQHYARLCLSVIISSMHDAAKCSRRSRLSSLGAEHRLLLLLTLPCIGEDPWPGHSFVPRRVTCPHVLQPRGRTQQCKLRGSKGGGGLHSPLLIQCSQEYLQEEDPENSLGLLLQKSQEWGNVGTSEGIHKLPDRFNKCLSAITRVADAFLGARVAVVNKATCPPWSSYSSRSRKDPGANSGGQRMIWVGEAQWFIVCSHKIFPRRRHESR